MLKKIAIIIILALAFVSIPTVHAESLPNLAVTQFYTPVLNQYAGSPFNGQDIRVKVENKGLGTAVDARLDLVITDASGTAVCVGRGKTLGEMPGYDTREYTFIRDEFVECPALTAGSYTLAAVVYSGGVIAESNEDDNKTTISVTVGEADNGIALSSLTATVSSASSQTVRVGYHASQTTSESRVEYATETFYNELGKFDINQSVTSANNADYSATLTVSPEIPYRYRAVVGSSNVQTDSRIFILMKQVSSSVLSFTDLVEVTELTDTSATLTWRTTQAAASTFAYEADNASVDGATAKTITLADTAATSTVKSVALTDLTPDTKYYFKITAGSGASAVSFTSFFKTNKAAYAPTTPSVVVTEPDETVIVTEPATPPAEVTPPSACTAAESGALIKTAGQAAVYYYANNCKAYVFPNEQTYFTWYADFSGVTVITDAAMSGIALGGNVTYRPGVKMIKTQSAPSVYIVAKGAKLHLIQDEAQAQALYGSDWGKHIDDVSPGFFTDYEVGAPIASVDDFMSDTLQAESTSINEDKAL